MVHMQLSQRDCGLAVGRMVILRIGNMPRRLQGGMTLQLSRWMAVKEFEYEMKHDKAHGHTDAETRETLMRRLKDVDKGKVGLLP